MLRLRALSVLCLFVLGCSTSKKAHLRQVDAPLEVIQKAESGILFVTIDFVENQGPVVEAAQSVFNIGIVKKEDRFDEGDIKCILKNDGLSIKTLFFENPLNTSFEIYGEEGELQRKEVQLERASKVIRLNYSFEWSELDVYWILDNEERSLARIKIAP